MKNVFFFNPARSYMTGRKVRGHPVQSPLARSPVVFNLGLNPFSAGRAGWNARSRGKRLGGKLAWTQAFLKFQKPLDMKEHVSCWQGPWFQAMRQFGGDSSSANYGETGHHPYQVASPSRGGPLRLAVAEGTFLPTDLPTSAC